MIAARERLPYLTAIDAVFAVAAVGGPVIGGWLTDTVGWRWAFWINLPVGLVAIVAALVLLPPSPRSLRRAPFDVAGALVLAAAVTLLVLVTASAGSQLPWTSPLTAALVIAAVAAVALFLRIESRTADPVLPLALLASRNVALAVGAGLLLGVAVFGTIGYLPSYLQLVQGLSPTHAGLMMLTLIGGLALTTTLAAQVVRRTGRYKALPVVGAAVVAAALLGMASLGPGDGLLRVGLYLFGLGAGIGCAWEVLVLVVQNAVRPDRVGVATAANGFFRGWACCWARRWSARCSPPGWAIYWRPAARLRDRDRPRQRDARALGQLPPELRDLLAGVYADALTPVFALLVPLVLAALVGLALIRPDPLATRLVGASNQGVSEEL